jgi:hypothetical protein
MPLGGGAVASLEESSNRMLDERLVAERQIDGVGQRFC